MVAAELGSLLLTGHFCCWLLLALDAIPFLESR